MLLLLKLLFEKVRDFFIKRGICDNFGDISCKVGRLSVKNSVMDVF